MKDIYNKIWELAKPYYQKGRPMDIAHIEWFMQEATRIGEVEGLDDTILLPLAILHDVGYSEITDVAKVNYYGTDIRSAHMAAGKVISTKILHEIGYPEDKIQKIVDYVGIHDNWAFGEVDLYTKDSVLGTFKDLDYLWIYTKEGMDGIRPTLEKSGKIKLNDNISMLAFLQNEPSPIYGKKPFSNESTRLLHDQLLHEREMELAISGKEVK